MKRNRILMLGGALALAVALAGVVVLGTQHHGTSVGAASNQLAAVNASLAPTAATHGDTSNQAAQTSATPVQQLGGAATGIATQSASTNQLAVADTPTSSHGQHPGQQGVKVHGWWTITVKNPDGSIASQRQFENSLTALGATGLVHLLMGTSSAGNWAVELDGTTPSNGPCLDQNQNRSSCVTIDTRDADTVTSPGLFKTLSVDASSTKAGFGGLSSDVLVLSGYVTAGIDGNVRQVSTGIHYCIASLAPASCRDFAGTYEFTAATLSSPISVIKDQQIAVKVVISFS